MVKLHGKKKLRLLIQWHTITCRLEMQVFFFSPKSEIIVVCYVYVTQSSLKQLFPVTRVMSGEREIRSGLSQFHRRNKSNKGTRYKKINCRPDYILERIDFWCRF